MPKPRLRPIRVSASSKPWTQLDAATRRNIIATGVQPHDYEFERGKRLYAAGNKDGARAAYASGHELRDA